MSTVSAVLLSLLLVFIPLTETAPDHTDTPTSLAGPPMPGRVTSSSSVSGYSPLSGGLDQVDVSCELTLKANQANGNQGTIKMRCKFRNRDPDNEQRFVFCTMLDLHQGSKGTVTGLAEGKDYRLVRSEIDTALGKQVVLKCEEVTGSGGSENSYHFGCREVTIPKATRRVDDVPLPGESEWIEFDSGTYTAPDGKTIQADDFEISYADMAQLVEETTDDQGNPVLTPIGFDKSSCRNAAGQANFLVPGTGVTIDSAVWVQNDQPFVDSSYLAIQDSETGEVGGRWYVSLEERGCLPEGVTLPIDWWAPCSLADTTPEPVSVDLNLFFIVSEMADPGVEFPTYLTSELSGQTEGVRVSTTPGIEEPFAIPGGDELFGSLLVCSAEITEECVVAEAQEGQTVEAMTTFFDLETNEMYFHQHGRFINDTMAPVVLATEFDPQSFAVQLTARDDTTSPVAANVYYSVDEGQTWGVAALDPAGDISDGAPERAFSAILPPFNGPMYYFFEVFDAVGNVMFYSQQSAEAAIEAVPICNSDFIDDGFNRTWGRIDQPVLDGLTSRTWVWGPVARSCTHIEPYAEGIDGERSVLYYDKSRMELTDPSVDPSSIWRVTNGLLATEMISGNIQIGDNEFVPRGPAGINVAGDFDDPDGPTYATFSGLLTAPAGEPGTVITQFLDRRGTPVVDDSFTSYAVMAAQFDEITGHTIAGPFWDFMNASGPVYLDGLPVNDLLFQNPYYATGRPITEAYWARVKVGDTYRDVLVQCFERRCLTYTPGNPAGFVVEAGNVGLHYYIWRYAQFPSIAEPD